MLTIETIKDAYPDIDFKLSHPTPLSDPILTITKNGKFVITSWHGIEYLTIELFNDRVLKPCLDKINKVI